MKYMKLYGSMGGNECCDVARLRRRIKRYRRALRRCARHRKREREAPARPGAPASGHEVPFTVEHLKMGA
jgi:hypothetical protein